MHDKPWSGRPVNATGNDVVSTVCDIVNNDRRLTLDDIIVLLPLEIETLALQFSESSKTPKIHRNVHDGFINIHKQQCLKAKQQFLKLKVKMFIHIL